MAVWLLLASDFLTALPAAIDQPALRTISAPALQALLLAVVSLAPPRDEPQDG